MMSLWDALRMNMMISYQELVRTFPNGLLMLACLHRLFDADLMAINPDLLTVHFKPDCTYFAKSILEGKKINAHSVPLNKSGLLERWLRFDV
ncbi:TPA: hypothetical protein ACU76E_004814 [Escherichia coli]